LYLSSLSLFWKPIAVKNDAASGLCPGKHSTRLEEERKRLPKQTFCEAHQDGDVITAEMFLHVQVVMGGVFDFCSESPQLGKNRRAWDEKEKQ
jgi:hypothetical protein